MSSLGVRSAIAHAAVDEGFRRTLLTDPSSACRTAGYEISETEITTLATLQEDSFGTGFYAAQSLPGLLNDTHVVVEGLAPLGLTERGEEESVV